MTASLFSSAVDGGRGGDIYFLSKCNHDLLTRIVVADVSGHGEVVSSISRYLYDAMIAHVDEYNESDLLEDLNSVALAQGIRALTTVAVGSYYKKDSNFRYAYAGHPPLLMKRAVESDWKEIQTGEDTNNLPLAVMSNPGYRQYLTRLDHGDRVAFYTDGLIEAPDPLHHRYGIERLKGRLQEAGAASIEQIRNSVITDARKHAGGDFRHDDVTLLLLEAV